VSRARLFLAAALVAVAITSSSHAIEPGKAGRMSTADLVGIWEAIQIDPMRLFVAEFHEPPGDSYVAMVSSDVLLFVVRQLSLGGNRLEMQCTGTGPAAGLALKISGSGWAAHGQGKVDATFTLTDIESKRVRQQWHLDLINYNGHLAESFLEMKKAAGNRIGEAKKASAPPRGPAPRPDGGTR
jgi:hypothetical protein